MSDEQREPSLLDRLSRQGEGALAKLAEELAGNATFAGAVGRAFQARDRAMQAQEAALGALGMPSAADMERLTRRLRSLSQRLEGIEDALDRLESRLDALTPAGPAARDRPGEELERRLEQIAADVAALRQAMVAGPDPLPRAQQRLTVMEP